MDKTIITKNVEETQKIGEELAKCLPSNVIALYGELGAGKTSFVQGLARGLGIRERIISPTFILIRKHQILSSKSQIASGKFYHVDLYRIEDDKSLEEQLSELIDEKNIVVIEWAERFKNLPAKRLDIFFKHLKENEREIHFQNHE